MKDTATINTIIARNLAFWRQAHGYTLDGAFFLGTSVKTDTLSAYERGEKPPLAAHFLQLAGALEVPVVLLGLDLGEEIYQTAAKGERWYELWSNLKDMEEEGGFEEAKKAVEQVREKYAAGN